MGDLGGHEVAAAARELVEQELPREVLTDVGVRADHDEVADDPLLHELLELQRDREVRQIQPDLEETLPSRHETVELRRRFEVGHDRLFAVDGFPGFDRRLDDLDVGVFVGRNYDGVDLGHREKLAVVGDIFHIGAAERYERRDRGRGPQIGDRRRGAVLRQVVDQGFRELLPALPEGDESDLMEFLRHDSFPYVGWFFLPRQQYTCTSGEMP